MSSRPPLIDAVAGYTARTLADLLDGGPATSALAPWVLAALVAPATRGQARDAIETELGLPAETAAAEVERLLAGGPSALRTAIALWRSPVLATNGEFGAWERGIPTVAASGPIPNQREADAWTEEATLGLIREFPVRITPEHVALLAAAIASRVRWDEPLAVVEAPANAWGLRQMLAARALGVYETPAGLIGAATARSQADGLAVYSFIGPPDASRVAVVGAALDLVGRWYGSAGAAPGKASPGATAVAIDALPAAGHAWTVEEGYGDHPAVVPAFEERVDGLPIDGLPAIREACAEIGRIATDALPPAMRPAEVEARMSAMARYDRLGFEAAAVATIAVRATGMPMPRPTLRLRFDRAHLAVAVAIDEPWAGLPLFAAWVDAGAREPEVQSGAAPDD